MGPRRLVLSALTLGALIATGGCAPAHRAPGRAAEGTFAGDGGVRLHWARRGSGGPTVVLLHGGPGGNADAVWLDIEPLASHATFWMYDQRGGGRSELVREPAALDVDRHLADLEAFRRFVGARRMILAGESWGAGLAALYAGRHPERVERLLLLGPMPYSRSDFDRRFADPEVAGRIAEMRRAMPEAEDPVAVCREFFALYLRAYFADPAAFARRRGSSCDAPPEAVRNYSRVATTTIASLGEWDFRPMLTRLRMPALVVEGAESAPTIDSARGWAAALGDGRLLLVPGAGHFPQVERPDLFFPRSRRSSPADGRRRRSNSA